jgi:hypothetical protein
MMNDSLRTLGMNTPGEKNASIVTHLDKNGYVKFIFGNPITHGMAIVRLMEKPIWFGTEDRAKDEIDRLINKTHQVAEIGGELVWV